MKVKKTDQRSRYTQFTIRKSLLSLLAKKTLKEISVSELCKTAQITRGTFYNHFYDVFEEYIPGFCNRLLVTPGLTGYAQVNGGYFLLPEEKLVYDMEYIEKRSLKLDLWCIFKTVGIVFTHEGAR